MAETTTDSGVARRTIIKGAAWSVPVIAAAVAVPLAAASAADASLAILVGSGIQADPATSTATGTFSNSGLSITNVTDAPWETGALTSYYRLTGPWATGSITKPDGTSFAVGDTLLGADGTTMWTVTAVSANERRVDFSAPSQSVSANTQILLPSAKYSGTWIGTIDGDNPINATVSVTATELNGGQGTTSSSSYPS